MSRDDRSTDERAAAALQDCAEHLGTIVELLQAREARAVENDARIAKLWPMMEKAATEILERASPPAFNKCGLCGAPCWPAGDGCEHIPPPPLPKVGDC